ncbi:hypothetical protein [Tritonibacter scottomollicae]|uniref:hypothetical protein n=1 Tax=Tritonibacter scottomollicae TaxID=483013 RepID=UPI003AA85D77
MYPEDLKALSESDLTDLYGELVEPNPILGFSTFEAQKTQVSLTVLDVVSAPNMQQLMNVVSSDFRPATFNFWTTPLLWLVDAKGRILFALEEMFFDKDDEYIGAKHRKLSVPDGGYRLGHPAFVGAQKARISGEIFFDRSAGSARWMITNGSGRYGIGRGRTERQLENVARRFKALNLSLETKFIKPRRRS